MNEICVLEEETDPDALLLLRRIAEANRRNILNEGQHSEIGIFWIDVGTDAIIKFSTPWTDAVGDRDIYDVGVTHSTYWEQNRARYGYPDLEYEELPRGRVIYKKKVNKFTIYLNSRLGAKKYKSMILDAFKLDRANTVFCRDDHYETTTDCDDPGHNGSTINQGHQMDPLDQFKNTLPYPRKAQFTATYWYRAGVPAAVQLGDGAVKYLIPNLDPGVLQKLTSERVLDEVGFKAAREEYNRQESSIDKRFFEYFCEELDIVGHPKAALLYAKAYEHGHSSGHAEIMNYGEILVNLIRD